MPTPEVKARAELPSPIELKARLDELEVRMEREVEVVRQEAAEEYAANLADLRAELLAEIPRILRDFKIEVVDQFRREMDVLLNGENAEEAVAQVAPARIAREQVFNYVQNNLAPAYRGLWDNNNIGGNGR